MKQPFVATALDSGKAAEIGACGPSTRPTPKAASKVRAVVLGLSVRPAAIKTLGLQR
jgi:hypothetical protein